MDICTNIIKSTSNEFILVSNDNIDTLSDNNAHNNLNDHEIEAIRHNFIIETASYHTMIKPLFTEKGNLLVWTTSTQTATLE